MLKRSMGVQQQSKAKQLQCVWRGGPAAAAQLPRGALGPGRRHRRGGAPEAGRKPRQRGGLSPASACRREGARSGGACAAAPRPWAPAWARTEVGGRGRVGWVGRGSVRQRRAAAACSSGGSRQGGQDAAPPGAPGQRQPRACAPAAGQQAQPTHPTHPRLVSEVAARGGAGEGAVGGGERDAERSEVALQGGAAGRRAGGRAGAV